MFLRCLVCFCLVLGVIHAKTDEEIRLWFFRQALECNKDHPISQEEMQMLQKSKMPDTKDAKCLLACVFKKSNYINDKGMFDLEGATASVANDYADDVTKVENSKKLMDICQKVNSEAVSDGAEGCDRAVHLYKCFFEHGPQLGFILQGTR